MLILFGYALSFDIKNLPVAVVVEHASEDTGSAVASLRLSRYFVVHPVGTMVEAERLMAEKKVYAILRFAPFLPRCHAGRCVAAGGGQCRRREYGAHRQQRLT